MKLIFALDDGYKSFTCISSVISAIKKPAAAAYYLSRLALSVKGCLDKGRRMPSLITNP